MRPRLTFANVVSCLALFVALGSGAYAATQLPKNSVGPKQLKKNAVTTAKIKKEAVTADKVKAGTLTGAQINTASLGTVPASTVASTAYTASTANSLATPEAWNVVGTPGQPEFLNGCKAYEGRAVKFFKDHEGIVHIEGLYHECKEKGDYAFHLPPGYRPDQLQQFTYSGATAGVALAIFESVPASPTISGAVGCGSDTCDLDGITFRAES